MYANCKDPDKIVTSLFGSRIWLIVCKLQISRQNCEIPCLTISYFWIHGVVMLTQTANIKTKFVWHKCRSNQSLKPQRSESVAHLLGGSGWRYLGEKTVWSVLPWNSWSNFCKAHATLIQDNSGLRSFGMESVGYIVMVRWGWTNSIIIFKGMSDWNQSTIPHSGLTPEDKKSTYFTSFFIKVILTFSLKYWKVSENLRPNLFGGLKRAMG